MTKMVKAMAALGVVAGLGAAVMPMASFAADATVSIVARVDNSLGLSVNTDEVNFGTIPTNGTIVERSLTATVSSTTGYTLSIRGADADNLAMVQVNESTMLPTGESGTGKEIPANTLTAAGAGWGYRVNDETTYTAITGTDHEIANSGNTDAIENDETVIRFGIKANGIANGTYKTSVVLTATANS